MLYNSGKKTFREVTMEYASVTKKASLWAPALPPRTVSKVIWIILKWQMNIAYWTDWGEYNITAARGQ